MSRMLLLAFAILLSAAIANAQEATRARGGPATDDNVAGWYDVQLKVLSSQCRLKPNGAGEWNETIEVTRGRRDNLVLHLEQLRSWFAEPVAVAVGADGSFHYVGSASIDLGSSAAAVHFTFDGGFRPDPRSFGGTFAGKHPFCAFEGFVSGRKAAVPPPSAPTPSSELSGRPAFTDSAIPPSGTSSQIAVASQMVGGTYATKVMILERRCLQDPGPGGRVEIQVDAQRGLVIPLQNFSGFFPGPLVLRLDGLSLSQTARLPVAAGLLGGSVPAQVNGAFTPDGDRFEAHFRVVTSLCRLSGTIEGDRLQ